MDPDKALQTLRAYVAGVSEGDQPEHLEMCEQFQALDEWLSKGGFLPGPWQR
jgi:hypothetical protein